MSIDSSKRSGDEAITMSTDDASIEQLDDDSSTDPGSPPESIANEDISIKELSKADEALQNADEDLRKPTEQAPQPKEKEPKKEEFMRPRKSLKERSKIPNSLYFTIGSVCAMEYFSGLWTTETLQKWVSSMITSIQTCGYLALYLRDVTVSMFSGEKLSLREYMSVGIGSALIYCVLYVFVIAPFRAGLWTGERSKKHVIHRYMGLLFLVQYTLAWVEFMTNYENGARHSVLPHTIVLNGVIQGLSAYFSFKVLPELEDAGYYSDKAVVSRNFVHENIFFNVLCMFGSVYYNPTTRLTLRSSTGGRIVESLFLFFPYVIIRPWYPTTRLRDAGQTRNGRTARNEWFYNMATFLIKIFYLWAKYFLGFMINFVVFLDKMKEENWKFLQGLYLLNVGTVSLAMFLHTLRFKKVLPPRMTMSVYLLQIYGTFSAIPYAYDIFTSHPKLCAVAFAGILCNMTRSKFFHAAWCVTSFVLLQSDLDIDW